MKNKLISLAGAVALLGAAIYLARAPLQEVVVAKLTDNMFVASDGDSFNPGLAVGQRFPQIAAVYQGAKIHSVEQFINDRGMVFIANRSADW
jgi:hypothetical protein